MHAVLETTIFSRRADALLNRDERAELVALLATDPDPDPDAGDVIPGTGGIRKLRFAAASQGKRGIPGDLRRPERGHAGAGAADLRQG